MFCDLSHAKVYEPFLFLERTVNGITYLDMLEQRVPQVMEDSHDFKFQQVGASPHWHLNVQGFLSESLPDRWVGIEDLALHFWPPRSPDLTPFDYFLWDYIKEVV